LLGASCFGGSINTWIADSSGNIGQVDVSTGIATLVGNAGVVLTDIAFSPSGDLYGISFTELYSINTLTGAATAIGSLDIASDDANALVFSSSGTLYTATVAGSLYTVNTATGAATDVGSLSGYGSAGDLAFVDGTLYLATSSNDLVSVNPSTGAATLVGPFGVSNVFGLATPDDVNLFAAAGQDLYTVDLSTGAATFDVTWAGNAAGLGGANGQAFAAESNYTPYTPFTPFIPNSTPEPAPLALIGAGFGLLGLRRLRKH
jgi:outer membrane protein assembly factor BamB